MCLSKSCILEKLMSLACHLIDVVQNTNSNWQYILIVMVWIKEWKYQLKNAIRAYKYWLVCRLSVNTKGIEVSWSSKPSTMYPLMCGCIGLSEIPPTGCKPGGGEQAYKPPQRTSSAPRSNQNILSSTRHLRRNCISTLHATFRPA